MPEYSKMYYILCDAVSKALDELPVTNECAKARALLQNALYSAEELYINTLEEPALEEYKK